MICPITQQKCPEQPCRGLADTSICNHIKGLLNNQKNNTFDPNKVPEPEASPSLIQKGVNFTFAAIKHVANGLKNVEDWQYQERLSICSTCEHQSIDGKRECLICGCPVEKKARWASENCPLSLWPTIPQQPAAEMPVEAPARPVLKSLPVQPTPAKVVPPKPLEGGCNCGK